jgi:hypothetical protein
VSILCSESGVAFAYRCREEFRSVCSTKQPISIQELVLRYERVAAQGWWRLNRLLPRAGFGALSETVTWNHNETISRKVSSGDVFRCPRAIDAAPEPCRKPASRRRMGGTSPGLPAKRCVVGANASRARRSLDAVRLLSVDVFTAVKGPDRSVGCPTAGDRYQDRRVTAFRALGDRLWPIPFPKTSRIQRPLLGPDAPYQPSHSAAQPLPFPDHPQPRAATQVPSRLTTIRCAISCVMIGTITVGGVPITDESTGDATAK